MPDQRQPAEATPPTAPEDITPERAAELRRLEREKKDQRQVWVFLSWFLFGIHIIAFVMIYAVRHAK